MRTGVVQRQDRRRLSALLRRRPRVLAAARHHRQVQGEGCMVVYCSGGAGGLFMVVGSGGAGGVCDVDCMRPRI